MDEMTLRVSEIFTSVDGEGPRAGGLATFVRLHGCNLRCVYCDTQYACAGKDFEELSMSEISARVLGTGIPHVTLTGGEPLAQAGASALVLALADAGLSVSIETNGCVKIPDELFEDPGVSLCIDIKSPSSGECGRRVSENFGSRLRDFDCVKLVVGDSDLPWARTMLTEDSQLFGRASVYLSPVFGELTPTKLAEFMKSLPSSGVPVDLLRRTRMQIQLHKVLWPETKRGV